MVADGGPLAEVARVKPLHDLFLDAGCGGQMGDAVRIERVARPCELEVVLETILGGHGRDPVVHRLRLPKAHAVLRGQHLRQRLVDAWRTFRSELEAAVADAHVVPPLERAEGGLEPSLADVAPRTHDVGPDLHVHGLHRISRGTMRA